MTRHIAKVRPDHGADPASAFPVGFNLEPHGINHLHQILSDGIGDGFEEAAFVAEGVVIEFQGFEFDALAAILGGFRLVSQGDDAEVWVSSDWAHAGKLLGNMLDHKGSIGWGFEDFKDGCIWHRPSVGALGAELNPDTDMPTKKGIPDGMPLCGLNHRMDS